MKNASDDLKHEHEAILLSLRILERMCGRIEAGAAVPVSDIMEIINFLKLFADKCHHGKEEGFLFPALEEAGIPRNNGPIGVMLAEHDMGRGFIREMESAAAAGEINGEKFTRPASGYISLLRAHIDKENNVLFPMGDSKLAPQKQAELIEQFEKFEEETTGPEKHEEFHRMLSAMKKKYPGEK